MICTRLCYLWKARVLKVRPYQIHSQFCSDFSTARARHANPFQPHSAKAAWCGRVQTAWRRSMLDPGVSEILRAGSYRRIIACGSRYCWKGRSEDGLTIREGPRLSRLDRTLASQARRRTMKAHTWLKSLPEMGQFAEGELSAFAAFPGCWTTLNWWLSSVSLMSACNSCVMTVHDGPLARVRFANFTPAFRP